MTTKTMKMLVTFLSLLIMLLMFGCAQHSSYYDMGNTMNTMEQAMDEPMGAASDRMMEAPMQDTNDKAMGSAMDTMKTDSDRDMRNGADDGAMMK